MSSPSSNVTVELLDALLSPDLAARQQAEQYLDNFQVHDRARGLLAVLMQLCGDNANNTGRIMLACVLLRRTIANLGGIAAYGSSHTAAETITLLQHMMQPLTSLFSSSLETACRRQIGHCLAELCCSLELVANKDNSNSSTTAMRHILTSIGGLCSQADPVALSLLADLADRAPKSLCAFYNDLPALLQSSISNATSDTGTNSLEALTQAICNVAIATQIASAAATSNRTTISAMIPDLSDDNEDIRVDPCSPAAQLGTSCVVPLLATIKTTFGVMHSLQGTLEHLQHAALHCPSLFAGDYNTLSALITTCLTLSSSTTLDDSIRLASLAVLSSLTSNHDVKRKVLAEPSKGVGLRAEMLQSVIQTCAQFIVTGVDEDVEEWTMDPATIVDDVPTWEEDDTAMYAESLLCSFLQNLGGAQQSLPVVLPMVESLLSNSTQWQHQRAALSILEQCLYAAPVTFAQHAPIAVETALHLASTNGNPRVQFQAMVLLGALCEADDSLGCQIRVQNGGRLLQAMAGLVASRCTKVAAIACLAVVSYCRGGQASTKQDGESLVTPFLKDILLALVTGPLSLEIMNGSSVDSGAVAVKVRAVGAVACLAEATGEAFVPFYRNVVPGLLGCAEISSNQYDIARLRGAAIEAVTIVGEAVAETSRDLYVSDAGTVMQIVIPLLQSEDAGSNSSIPMDQVLSACARIAAVMQEEYAPYVKVVLPRLLTKVSAPPDIQFSEGDESGLEATRRGDRQMDEEEGTESMTVALPGKGLTKVTINSTRMYEKAMAARAIYEHASGLQAAFGPYVENNMDALVPLIDFKYSADVRGSVCKAVAATFDAACAWGEESGDMALAQKYMSTLAMALSKQILDEDPSDHETLFSVADSLSDVYYSAYRRLDCSDRSIIDGFSIKDARETVPRIMTAMVSCLERRAKLYRSLEGVDGPLSGEDEMEEYTIALAGQEEVLTPLVDCVGYTLKFLREDFLPIFEAHVAPILGKFLNAGADIRARYAAICLFDDCVEHCGSRAAATYSAALTEGVMLGIDDTKNGEDMGLKQVSVYGIAQLARYAPLGTLDANAPTILNSLIELSRQPKDDSDRPILIENAVSALASLTLFEKAPLRKVAESNKSAILSTFLDQLPLREDESEAKICHAGLCWLIENGQISLAAEAQRLLRIVGSIFAYIAEGEDLASPDTQGSLARILLDMQREVPGDRMQAAFGNLDPEAQDAINSAMHLFAQNGGANLVSP